MMLSTSYSSWVSSLFEERSAEDNVVVALAMLSSSSCSTGGKRRLSGCVRLKRKDILYGFKNEILMTLCALIDLGRSILYVL